jgi:hypothetical protein
MSKLLFPVFFLFGYFAFGQISFYKQFSNNGYDYGEGITQMADSSYLITGSSSSFFEGPAQAFILKLDSLGNFKWSKHFGGAESDGGKRIMCIENDGILVAGFTNSSGAGAYDFYLFKTDVSGTLLWEKTYGTESWDRVYDAALTRDSGVIMVGETLNTDDGEPDILLVRTDKNGNELWSQQIGNVGADMIKCITPIDDSTFALGGKVFVADSMMHKAYVCKMDENGVVWWEDTLDFVGQAQINSVCSNGAEINFVGDTDHLPSDNATIGYKCDSNGSFLFDHFENADGINKLVGVDYFGSSNRLAMANRSDNQYSYGGYDLFFSQNYPALPWELLIGTVHSAENVFCGQLISTSDNGVVAVGNFENIGLGGSNLYVIKMLEDLVNDANTLTNFESLVNVNEIPNDPAISVFPNPARSEITVFSTNHDLKNITICDGFGRILKTQDSSTNNTYDISFLSQGNYIIMLEFKNGNKGYKNLVVLD